MPEVRGEAIPGPQHRGKDEIMGDEAINGQRRRAGEFIAKRFGPWSTRRWRRQHRLDMPTGGHRAERDRQSVIIILHRFYRHGEAKGHTIYSQLHKLFVLIGGALIFIPCLDNTGDAADLIIRCPYFEKHHPAIRFPPVEVVMQTVIMQRTIATRVTPPRHGLLVQHEHGIWDRQRPSGICQIIPLVGPTPCAATAKGLGERCHPIQGYPMEKLVVSFMANINSDRGALNLPEISITTEEVNAPLAPCHATNGAQADRTLDPARVV